MNKLIVPVMLLFLYSCSTGVHSGDRGYLDDVLNTGWKLIEIDGEKLSDEKDNPSLKFSNEEYKITGNGGCNSYSAGIEVQDGKTSITNIISTKMFCDGRMDIENKYFTSLEKVETMRIKDERLHLIYGEKPILVFERLK